MAAGIGLGLPTRALQSAGAYSLFFYDNLGVVSITTEIAGLKPFSKPNVVGYDVVFAAQGQQTMTSRYDDSITDFYRPRRRTIRGGGDVEANLSFASDSACDLVNLKSFYFGCVVTNVVVIASAPLPCSIIVTGFRGQNHVAQKTPKFTPDGTVSNLGPANLKNSGFENVDRVEFDLVGGLEKLALAVLFDNFEYDAILKKGARYPG